MTVQFDMTTILGFVIAYAIIALIMYIMNRREASLDVRLDEIEAAERRRQQEERARRRSGGAAPAAASNANLAAAAVAAVHQFRAENN